MNLLHGSSVEPEFYYKSYFQICINGQWLTMTSFGVCYGRTSESSHLNSRTRPKRQWTKLCQLPRSQSGSLEVRQAFFGHHFHIAGFWKCRKIEFFPWVISLSFEVSFLNFEKFPFLCFCCYSSKTWRLSWLTLVYRHVLWILIPSQDTTNILDG